mmetsp:Transcript_2920/g.8561  ORF Transcript_2920/g.8561 Transcript_2920/m.8561 type:complete len:465 (+) Transcript_2920:3-1397(+)
MMDIDLREWSFPEDLVVSEREKLRLAAQCVPPSFAVVLARAAVNSWHDYGCHGSQPKFFGGDGTLRGDVLPDVVMVRKDNIWRVARIAEEPENSELILVCLAFNLETAWYHKDKVEQLDRRVGTEYDTLEQMQNGEAARVHAMHALGQSDNSGVEGIVQQTQNALALDKSPELDGGDEKHCNWSPAFRCAVPGTGTGDKALHNREPCEIIATREDERVVVHFPRTREKREVKVKELTPYSYPESSRCPYNYDNSSTPSAEMLSNALMRRLNRIILRDIYQNRGLMKYLSKMTLDSDKPGVSFLMGICPRTGVPYACMQRPEIAKLWLEVRELFVKANLSRNRDSRLTSLKVCINSRDLETREYRHDLGDALRFSGGTHVGGDTVIEGEEPISTWGRIREINRRVPHKTLEYTGDAWTVTMFSDYRCRSTQPFAKMMLDSVANGTLVEREDVERGAPCSALKTRS